MFRIYDRRISTYCDGLSRRSFLQLGVAGVASVSLADVLRAKAKSAEMGAATKDTAAKDTAVILLWLDGGPSHLDTYDMKPDAPADFRGIWRPIKTNVSGIEFSELFPKQAKVADKFSIIRSLYHNDGDHFGGAHRILTGRDGASGASQSSKSPCVGAVAAKVCGPRKHGMLPYVATPIASTVGLEPGYFGGDYLGREYNPFETGGDPNDPSFKVNSFNLPQGLTLDRLQDRRTLQLSLDRLHAAADLSGTMDAMDRFEQQAFEFISKDTARKAFDLSSEPAKLRGKYGRTSFGQSTLLARRLVEAGATFVTAFFGGWDHHWNLQGGYQNNLPQVDAAVSALFEDLEQRGLLEKVLVVMLGEFSRTPRMNNGYGNGTPGRDHWGNAMSCLIGGGGVKGGQIVGATDRRGEAPAISPVTPQDLHATIYKVLGVDPQIKFLDRTGRPRPLIDNGTAISELF